VTGQDSSNPADTGSASCSWLGHATVLIELDGIRLLTDPVIRPRVGPLRRISAPVEPARLDRIDAVLVSHLHADHADPRSLRRLGPEVPVVAPRGARRWLEGRGVSPVLELAAGEELTIGATRVVAVPAVHDGRRWPWDQPVGPVGYLVRGSGSIYFAGDTDLFPQLVELRGQVDLALLPVWGWGRTLGPGHLDPERAAMAAAWLAPAVAIPIHWGTFALPWLGRHPRNASQPAEEFRRQVAERAPGVEVRLLRPGQITRL
jgi:L-ascorbate metabolism protein UlaG (beta-lactamase superfamily)